VRRRVIEKDPMRVFTVFAKTFAMIANQDYQCIFVPVVSLEVSKEVRQRRIRIRDLAVVEPPFVHFVRWCPGLIGIMRIVEVNPNELMRVGCRLVEPILGALYHVHTSPFEPAPAGFCCGLLRKVVVKVESSIQARCQGFAVQNYGTDKSCGSIPILPEHLTQGRISGHEGCAEVPDSMRAWQETSQNGGVGDICKRTRSKGLLETNSITGQLIHGRRLNTLVPVTADMVTS